MVVHLYMCGRLIPKAVEEYAINVYNQRNLVRVIPHSNEFGITRLIFRLNFGLLTCLFSLQFLLISCFVLSFMLSQLVSSNGTRNHTRNQVWFVFQGTLHLSLVDTCRRAKLLLISLSVTWTLQISLK